MATWFLAFYLIRQAKNEVSSLELSTQLCVNHDTAWQLHSMIQRSITER
jgi:hypothetical protein